MNTGCEVMTAKTVRALGMEGGTMRICHFAIVLHFGGSGVEM